MFDCDYSPETGLWVGTGIAAVERRPPVVKQKVLTEQEWRERGLKRHAKGDFDGAIHDFDEALRRNPYGRLKPEDAVVYNHRGLARLAKGDLDERWCVNTRWRSSRADRLSVVGQVPGSASILGE